MLTSEKLVKLIFLVHCGVALLGHLFLLVMPIGLVKLILSAEYMDFWIKGLFLGTVYISIIYITNHISNAEGFCVLTHLENHFRKKADMPLASNRFVPRFYDTVKKIIYKLTKKSDND